MIARIDLGVVLQLYVFERLWRVNEEETRTERSEMNPPDAALL